jgi:hypothetical protein
MRAMTSGLNVRTLDLWVVAVQASTTIAAGVQAADGPTERRVFVDFDDEAAVQLSFADAKAQEKTTRR